MVCSFCASVQIMAQTREWKVQKIVERGISCIACLDEQHCVFSGQETQYDDTYIFQTVDGGKTWRKIYADTGIFPKRALPLHSLAWISPDVIVASADSSYIIRSVDGGKTWTKNQIYDGFYYAKPMYFCDSLHGVVFEDKEIANEESSHPLITSDGGATWQHIPGPKEPIEWSQTVIQTGDCIAPGKYIGYTPKLSEYAISRTTDYGKTWDRMFNSFSLPNGTAWYGNFFFLDSMNGWFTLPGKFQKGYGYPMVIARTQNAGKTWDVVFQDTLPMRLGGFQAIAFTDSLHGIGTTSGRICRTTDGGASWSVDSVLLEKGSVTLVAQMKQEPHVVTGGGGLIAYLSEVSSAEQPPPASKGIGEIVVRRIGEYLEINFASEHATPVQVWGDDLQGQRVITERTIAGDPGKGKIRIDIGDLPSGVYFITVQQGKEQRTEGVQIVR